MTHQAALDLAREMMNAHGLQQWQVKIKYATASLALCDYNKKTIYLTPKLIGWVDDSKVKDAILHEIAHALVGYGHGHDDVWTRKANEIGCSGDATFSLNEDLVAPVISGGRIALTCPTCGKSPVEELKSFEYDGRKFITLECMHVMVKKIIRATDIAERTSRLGHKPYPFQVKSVQFLENSGGRALIAHEMGLGKTVIDNIYRKFHPETLPCLVVCKAGLTLQWFKSIYNWTYEEATGRGDVAQIIGQRETIFPGFKYYIISFDLLRNIDPERLKRLGIKSLTIDECQHIKNPASQRTQEVRKLIKLFDIQYITALSGTPFKNRGSEYFTILNMLHPERFPSIQAFMNTYVDYYWNGHTNKEAGIRNLPKFREKTSDFVLRYERAEVMPDLPTVSRNMQYVELQKEYEKAYDKATDDFIKTMQDSELEGRGMTMSESAHFLAELAKLRRITGMSKVPDCVDYVSDFLESTDRKICIFLHHKSVAKLLTDQLNDYCRARGLEKPLVLSADLNGEERNKVQDKFNDEAKFRILIASTLASGEGLNLQKMCSDCIVLERQWNPANEEQAESRFVRIGQTADKVSATYLLAGNTIDEWLTEIIEFKRAAFIKTMNKPTAAGIQWDQQDLMKALTQKIISEGRKKWTTKKVAGAK
jgi:SNF2 family DNA or RNA helicase